MEHQNVEKNDFISKLSPRNGSKNYELQTVTRNTQKGNNTTFGTFGSGGSPEVDQQEEPNYKTEITELNNESREEDQLNHS
jgi:hypothetical protein